MSELPDRVYLTPLLNRIADVAGERAAIILAREKAGQEVYIPNKVKPGHWLAEMVGLDAARAIAEVFGAQDVALPPSINGTKRKLAEALAKMIEQGHSVNKITAATGVARSTVFEHKKRQVPKKDPDQGSLF